MWQGVEYTAASGGMEEAIKNYCKKETGEPLLFFLEKRKPWLDQGFS